MDFVSGEKVAMLLENECVAIGSVCRTDPDSTCSGTRIGQGNVSVLVEQCLKDVDLPFPTMDTTNLGSAVWSNVCWPKMLLQNYDDYVKRGQSTNNEENHTDSMNPPIVDAMPITSLEIDIQIRESWKNKRVLLKDMSMMQTINEGLILYVFPYETVNFELLDNDCVGVAIERANSVTQVEFSVSPVAGSINLVKWPIKQVTLLDGSPLQRYAPLDDMHNRHGHAGNDVDAMTISRKRRYTFINRIPKQRLQPASNFYLLPESIQRVSSIDCCAKKCCQFASRGMVTKIREDFWGQSQESRLNYVYDVFSVSWYRDSTQKMRYDFRQNGVNICCKAWSEMHGIPKTSFYRYRKNFELGVRQHVHGNTGSLRRGVEHTSLARALLQEFVENNSERMPNKSRTMLDGSRETQLVIPETYKQVDILSEINSTLDQMGYQKMLSKSSFGRIWNTEYPHVALTKSSEFSKCSLCSSLKARLESKPTLQERERIIEERKVHMHQQQSCRNLYYAWRTFSETQPRKYVCIIHDKMDQKKTAIPRLRVTPKGVDSGYNLPMALIGMITHGHGEGHYGHFVLNGLWPSDPNLTIGSLACCLHNLERMDKHNLGDLATDGLPRSNVSILCALNSREALDYHNMSDGKEPITAGQTPPEVTQATSNTDVLFRRLPENLLLQLDNCAGENKNRYLFAYLSLLVARGVFKTIQLGFLMVGHTHEDIDAMFSRFSEKLRVGQTFTLPHLMDTLRTSSTSSPAPFLLKEVPDFKHYCEGYICDGQEALTGHSKPLQFRFFMQGDTPMMQYKVHVAAPDWRPSDGGIPLWKTDAEGKPMLPQGNPPLLQMAEHVKAHEDVISGLKAYVKFWQNLGNGSSVPRYYRPVIDYWNNVIQELGKPVVSESRLYKDFWPKSQGSHQLNDVDIQMEAERFLGIEELNDHYCGPQREKPREEFNPMSDVKQGDFILLYPENTDVYPVWLAMAETDIVMDLTSPNYKKLLIQYWAPCARKNGMTDAEVYADCWKGFWAENKAEQRLWENADAIVWSWRPKRSGPFPKVKIPKKDAQKAQEGIRTFGANEIDGNVIVH